MKKIAISPSLIHSSSGLSMASAPILTAMGVPSSDLLSPVEGRVVDAYGQYGRQHQHDAARHALWKNVARARWGKRLLSSFLSCLFVPFSVGHSGEAEGV